MQLSVEEFANTICILHPMHSSPFRRKCRLVSWSLYGLNIMKFLAYFSIQSLLYSPFIYNSFFKYRVREYTIFAFT